MSLFYKCLVYRYDLKEWEVGVMGLSLVFVNLVCMGFYDPIFQRLGAYGAILLLGPVATLIGLAQCVAAKAGLWAFVSCAAACCRYFDGVSSTRVEERPK